jgi:hypothetical protein
VTKPKASSDRSATYASIVRQAMARQRITIRSLERSIGFSYEHIRKVTSGIPVMSQAFNEQVCKVVGLDADRMWQIAVREKAERRHGGVISAMLPNDSRLTEVWGELSSVEQERVVRIAQAFADANRATRVAEELSDPREIEKQIRELVDRLYFVTSK